MTVTAPALHWYQLETGVYVPDYFVQLDTCVRALCAANAVTAPSATVTSQLPGGYLSTWMSQTDTAVRALCSALSVTAPVAMLAGQTFGQLEATYPSSLDVAVRALCAAAPGYTGPLDLTATPAVVAYGQRALSAAKLGTALYTIRRDSDGTTQSFNSNASDGTAPVAAIAAFIGGGNGFVTAWNDQSGNGSNVIQATSANQPGWLASTTNSRPGFSFAQASKQWLATAGNITIPTGAATVFAVIKIIDDSTVSSGYLTGLNADDSAGANGPDWSLLGLSAGDFSASGDATGFGTSYSYITQVFAGYFGAYNLLESACGPVSGSILLNGTGSLAINNPGAVDDVTWPLGVGIIDVADAGNFGSFNGQIIEILIFPSILSSADRTAIRQNIATYYGIVL